MNRLLVIDDDCALFALLSEYLGSAGFECDHAADGDVGLAFLARRLPDAVILDVMLPGKNGHEVLRRIRRNAAAKNVPVLMLSARGGEDDKVAGLDSGADDYLAKPFGAKELVARLRALLRRIRAHGESGDPSAPLILGDLLIDRQTLAVKCGDEVVNITSTELRLLELLIESPGLIVDRDTLYREVIGHPPFASDRSLDMMVSRLRKKLGPRRDGGERILAARGRGYILLPSGEQ
jgi:two-component system response regulator CpxR